MDLYNVFDSETEYEKVRAYDYAKYIAYHQSMGASLEFINGTKDWAIGKNRATDNKIVYLVFEHTHPKYVRIVCINDNDVISKEEYDNLSLSEQSLYKEVAVEQLNTGGVWFPSDEIV